MKSQNDNHTVRTTTSTAQRELRRNSAKSAARALDVLEYFGAQARPMRAGEIARVFSLSPSTTDQLLKTLVDCAYLTFNPRTKLYFPSVRLLGFASMLSNYYDGERLSQLLSELKAEIGEKVWLLTLCDTRIQIVKGTDDEEYTGQKYAIDSIPGSVLLAQCSDADIWQIINRAIRYRKCAPERAETLIRSSLAARNAGYADGDSLMSNWWNLSVPVPRRSGDVPIALSIAGDSERIRTNAAEMLKIMREGIARVMC
jgi:DNA-binding IclR family transcriptional regulator